MAQFRVIVHHGGEVKAAGAWGSCIHNQETDCKGYLGPAQLFLFKEPSIPYGGWCCLQWVGFPKLINLIKETPQTYLETMLTMVVSWLYSETGLLTCPDPVNWQLTLTILTREYSLHGMYQSRCYKCKGIILQSVIKHKVRHFNDIWSLIWKLQS